VKDAVPLRAHACTAIPHRTGDAFGSAGRVREEARAM
jgi:hypothetical protein